ncbi:galactosylceramide sulfotransferase-like [Watersipora subatra]|uniref:galactosylceramide sulfotransferase-like n=1 Tax=Watersipora subatra TaxID=2589382 RepID=UPI00355C0CCA
MKHNNYGRLLRLIVVFLVTTTAFFFFGAVVQRTPNQPLASTPATEVVLVSAQRHFENDQSVRGNDSTVKNTQTNHSVQRPIKADEDNTTLVHEVIKEVQDEATPLQTGENLSTPIAPVLQRLGNYSSLRQISASPVSQFVFTKIEKTGSSTFFAVLSRFVIKHKLNILMQRKRVHIDWKKPKGVAWDIGPKNVPQADVLINHALYKKNMVDKYVRAGYKFVVMVREPVSWFKSATKYYRYQVGGSSTEQVLSNNKWLYFARNDQNGGPTGLRSWFHLAQLQWLGFDYSLKGNMTAITEYVHWLNKQIDVIMIHEQYDASLILFRRRFGWSYTDLFYRRYIITNSGGVELSERARAKLLSPQVNLGDKILYDTLNQTWWSQPEIKEEDFWEEVKFFSDVNLKTSQALCPQVLQTKKTYPIPPNKWCPPEELTVEICSQLLEKNYAIMMKNLGSYALGDRYNY